MTLRPPSHPSSLCLEEMPPASPRQGRRVTGPSRGGGEKPGLDLTGGGRGAHPAALPTPQRPRLGTRPRSRPAWSEVAGRWGSRDSAARRPRRPGLESRDSDGVPTDAGSLRRAWGPGAPRGDTPTPAACPRARSAGIRDSSSNTEPDSSPASAELGTGVDGGVGTRDAPNPLGEPPRPDCRGPHRAAGTQSRALRTWRARSPAGRACAGHVAPWPQPPR